MPKRLRKKAASADPAVSAFRVLQHVIAESEGETSKRAQRKNVVPIESRRRKNPAAVALGRKGGLKGGKARAALLTAEQRREIAIKAAGVRWGKKRTS